MTKIDKLKIDRLIHKLGLKYKLSDDMIRLIIETPDKFTHGKIKELDLDSITTEDELNTTKTNFNYYGLGKLYINFASIDRKNKQKKTYKDINSKRWNK